MAELVISPKTKLFDLLTAYPQLEERLIAMAPPFKKLRNPVLRRTITRVTTLSQAAAIGGLKVEDLVNELRQAVGQNLSELSEPEHAVYVREQPPWFDESLIVESIDIGTMLNAGEQPVHEVLSQMKRLKDDQILEVLAAFLPAPLIDKALSLNYEHWLCQKSQTEFLVYFKSKSI